MTEPDTSGIVDESWSEGSDEEASEPNESTEKPAAARRGKSTIRFPYMDVRDATTVAQALKSKFGSSCTLDQMAAVLEQKLSGGAFRTRLSSAATFGVIVSKSGQITLTDLGHRVADEHTRPGALVEAFLHVPLYDKIYKAFLGRALPGDAGLEKEIAEFGVVANQTDRARQVFTRSADQAGLFWSGKDKLVLPAAANGNHGGSGAPGDKSTSDGNDDGGGEKMSDAPLLKALWDTLPADKNFSTEQRKRFFTALAFNIDYVYGPPSDGGTLDPAGVANLWGSAASPNA
ncbi:MAG: hypothetical protein ACR2N4_01585 [Jatrophihabitans sp.]